MRHHVLTKTVKKTTQQFSWELTGGALSILLNELCISFMGLLFHSAWSSAEMTQLRSVQIVCPWVPLFFFLLMSTFYSTASLFANSALVRCSANTETLSRMCLAAFGPPHQGVWISRGSSVVKITGSLSRGRGFDSQHPPAHSQLAVNIVPRDNKLWCGGVGQINLLLP